MVIFEDNSEQMLENFLLRYALNLLFTFIVVRFIYYPKYRNNDFVFTFFLFNTILFVLCYLLAEADLKFGFAFGLRTGVIGSTTSTTSYSTIPVSSFLVKLKIEIFAKYYKLL